MDKNFLLVEELEARFIKEVAKYKKFVDENQYEEGFEFDSYHYEKVLSKVVYAEFVNKVNERLRNREFKKVYEYFTLSIAQFKTHIPRNRVYEFVQDFYLELNLTDSLDELDLYHIAIFALNAYSFYVRYYKKFEKYTEECFNDFKNGFFGKFNTNVENRETIAFFEIFNNNICYSTPILEFRHYLSEKIILLKKEILDNIFGLDKESRKAYLDKLKYDLEYRQQFKENRDSLISEWLTEYQIDSIDDVYLLNLNHPLGDILCSPTPSLNEILNMKFDAAAFKIQKDFYMYYLEYYIDNCLVFIDEYLKESDQSISLDKSKVNLNPKLKTNLNVPQLAYMFKMLMDINPPIFDIKTKKEIYQFIESNFTTKGKDDSGPTVAKLNNLYSDVDKATSKFWADKLAKMLQDARKN